MKVNAVEVNNHNKKHTTLLSMVNGAAIGAASGMVFKYAYPLTAEEKSTDEYIRINNKINYQKNEFSSKTKNFIDSIKAQENRSFAQDQFVKLFDGLKEGDHVKRSTLLQTLKKIKEEKPTELFEFKKLCKNTSALAEKNAKQYFKAYNLVVKHLRPADFFIATGAIAGTVIGLIDDIIKIETKN